MGICPFHPDKHPSMVVSPSRQTYKCFVCGKGGDVLQFVQDHEGMSFNEALTWLAHRVGIELPQRVMTDDEMAKAKERESQRIALKGATAFFQKHLPDAQSYLYSRGYKLDNGILQDFKIGYAPEGNIAKKNFLKLALPNRDFSKLAFWANRRKGLSTMSFVIASCSRSLT